MNITHPSIRLIAFASVLLAVLGAGCDPNDGGPPPSGEALEARRLDVATDGLLFDTKGGLIDDEDDVNAWLETEASDDTFEEERSALLAALDGLDNDERLVGFVYAAGGCSQTPLKVRGLYLDGSDVTIWANILHKPSLFGASCAAIFSETAYFAVRGAADATDAFDYVVTVDPDRDGPDYPEELNRPD